MKRSTKLALSLVLAVGTVAPAFAQDNFPDVPANHWAYEALARMKRDGLLVGYPDGLYRGGRPASRYELAVAMHAVYTNLKNITDGLDAQIRAIQGTTPGGGGDLQALKDAVAALQADMAAMKGYGDDIAALKRAAEVFDRELKSLGVDVEAMKKDLLDLSGRVKALEDKKPGIEISGDVNLLVLAGHSSGSAGITQDGRLVGVTPTGALGGIQQDVNILHEAAFTFTGTNASGVKFTGTAVIGNMLSDGSNFGGGRNLNGVGGATYGGDSLGSQSNLPAGRYTDNVNQDIYLQNLEASFTTRVFGLGSTDVRIGRVNHSVDPWAFQRIDNTSYYSNERWDNGKYAIDGLVGDFKLFGTKATAFGGRTSGRNSINGTDLNQVILGNNRVAGNRPNVSVPGGLSGTGSSDELANIAGGNQLPSGSDVDRILGLQAAFPLFKVGNISLSYLWMDSDNENGGLLGVSDIANRLEVYGGNADFTFGRIKVGGSYHENQLKAQSSNLVDNDNSAFDASVGYKGNRFDVYGKYREVEANYVAPGDWGRLGILRNPANIRGFQYGGSLNISDLLVLSGTGETSTGLSGGNGLAGAQPFDGDTKMNAFGVRLDYKFSPNVSLYGSFEETRFSNLTAGYDQGDTSKYRFATVGVGYGLSERAKLNVAYQYTDVNNEAFLNVADNGNGRNRGGLLTTQLTIKF